MKEEIFREFNSLSVVFSAPSSTFVEKRAYHIEDEEAKDAAGGARTGVKGWRRGWRSLRSLHRDLP